MPEPTPAQPTRSARPVRALVALVPILVAALWWWIGQPAAVPPSPLAPGEKVACLSYAPFEGEQTPFDETLVVPEAQIDRQFAALAAVTDCLRTYTVSSGLDVAPKLAEKHGLKLLLGVWLGRDRERNAAEIAKAIELANAYPGVIRGIVVGNEVLLRRELPVEALAAAIRTVKAGVTVPVTYADVWEFWERNVPLADAVDFVTVHILPYWEDDPVGVAGARDHVEETRRHFGEIFAGKPILIGETGWPSAGRMREDALPSPANQVRYLSEIVALAKKNGWDYNLIEAKDQPWKRQSEGTVGGHWGILTDGLAVKFHWGEPISNQPFWAVQAAGGAVVAALVILLGWPAASRTPARLGLLALAAGLALPWWVVEIPLISLDVWDWAFALVTLALSAALAGLGARMLAAETARPTMAGLLGGDPPVRATGVLAFATGWTLTVAAAILAATLVALLVDSRYRDFQTAAFVVPAIAALVVWPAAGTARVERLMALAIAAVGVGVAINEGPLNIQAAAFVAVALIFAVGLTGWPGRTSRIARTTGRDRPAERAT